MERDKQKDSRVEKNKCKSVHIPNISKFPSVTFFQYNVKHTLEHPGCKKVTKVNRFHNFSRLSSFV